MFNILFPCVVSVLHNFKIFQDMSVMQHGVCILTCYRTITYVEIQLNTVGSMADICYCCSPVTSYVARTGERDDK
jgi:hypothetical protein